MDESVSNSDDRRLWIGNLDTRITEYQLLKIVQKCGNIEKFDVLFHKSGPLIGQPRGYAFVTYSDVPGARKALDKLNGHKIGCKSVVVRLAKNINYDEIEKPKPKLEIPVLVAGGSSSSTIGPRKLSKEITIQAIEAKLKMLENRSDDFVVNKTLATETSVIQKYQYNKKADGSTSMGSGTISNTNKTASVKYNSKIRCLNGPYNKRHKR